MQPGDFKRNTDSGAEVAVAAGVLQLLLSSQYSHFC